MTDQGFPKRERLARKRDFEAFFALRPVHVSRDFRVKARPNGLDHHRLGLVVSRKVGHAVLRNRAKRTLREAYRLNKDTLTRKRGYVDLLIIVKPTPKGESRRFDTPDAQRQLARLWQ